MTLLRRVLACAVAPGGFRVHMTPVAFLVLVLMAITANRRRWSGSPRRSP